MSTFSAVGLVLGLLALAFVLYPILRPAAARGSTSAEDDELAARRQEIYRQILEVEFDQRVGKLDAADAKEQGESLLRQAAELLSAEHSAERDLDDAVEREIQAVRRALMPSYASKREKVQS